MTNFASPEEIAAAHKKIDEVIALMGLSDKKRCAEFSVYAAASASYDNGGVIYFEAEGYRTRGRMQVGARFADKLIPFTRDADRVKSITVSLDKDAASIVKDINKRLMPSFKEALARVKERKASNDTHVSRQTDAFSQIMGRGPTDYEARNMTGHVKLGESRVEFTVHSGTSCTVKVSDVSPEMVNRICAMLAQP